MSGGIGERIARIFLAPTAQPALDAPAPRSHAAAPVRERASARAAPAAITVIGDDTAAAFAVDLAASASRRAGGRPAVAAVWGAPAPAPALGMGTRRASRVAAELQHGPFGVVVAGGPVVVVTLPADPEEALVAIAAITAAAPDAVLTCALCGPRRSAFDVLIARQELVVLAPPGDGAPGLSAFARASLAAVAPAVPCVAVTLSAAAVPRPLRHRRAVQEALACSR